jgi:hypothetical protein
MATAQGCSMTKPVNLNTVRKAKARAAEAAKAAENRARFGRTKAEKLREKAEAERLAKAVDQSQRER